MCILGLLCVSKNSLRGLAYCHNMVMWQRNTKCLHPKGQRQSLRVGGESGEEEGGGGKGITRFLVVLGDINDAMRKSMTPNN